MVTAPSLAQPAYAQTAPGSVYGIRNNGVQSYLPIADKRKFEDVEAEEITKGLQRWWPEIFSNYGTPVANMLASPFKSGLMTGGLSAFVLALVTRLYQSRSPLAMALTGAGAALTGLIGYATRKQQNGNVIDVARRMPAGATKRDLMSDPVYQSDLTRRAMANGGGTAVASFGNALLGAALAGDTFSRGASYRTARP